MIILRPSFFTIPSLSLNLFLFFMQIVVHMMRCQSCLFLLGSARAKSGAPLDALSLRRGSRSRTLRSGRTLARRGRTAVGLGRSSLTLLGTLLLSPPSEPKRKYTTSITPKPIAAYAIIIKPRTCRTRAPCRNTCCPCSSSPKDISCQPTTPSLSHKSQ